MTEERENDRQPVYLTRPPKPVSEMTEAELDAWADEVIRAFTEANPRLAEDEDREAEA